MMWWVDLREFLKLLWNIQLCGYKISILSFTSRGIFSFYSSLSLLWLKSLWTFSGKSFFFNFIYFWLPWVFVPVQRLSLVVASRGCSLFCAPASHQTGFSHRGVRALGQRGFCIFSVWALEHRLGSCYTGLFALRHVKSSQTGNRTHAPCTGRWILYHWSTSEFSGQFFGGHMFVLVLSQ